MPLSARTAAILSAALAGSMFLVVPASAQSGSIDAVMQVCAPVIDQEYQGDVSRYGQCVQAVKSFVAVVGAPSDGTNQQVADLAVALTTLYQDLDKCLTPETELPEALDVAAAASNDEQQRAQIIEVRATIYSCEVGTTAAIGLEDAVAGQPQGASPF
jgi:hypothetical protein